MEYYTMTTDAGDQSIAKAIQTGATTTFKQIAVGDGNGVYYEPAKTQTALRREVWRGDAVMTRDPNNVKRVVATATIPATVGGFTIREAGIFDSANVLMVISKLPLSEKVSPDSGASSDMVIRMYVEVSDADAVAVIVDPSAVIATKADVDKAKADEEADLAAHKGDAVSHMTQAQHDQLTAAVPNTRKINGHALSGDVTVTAEDVSAPSLTTRTSIPSGADLHAYLTPGCYCASSNEVAASLLNCPAIYAFTLDVNYPTGTQAYIGLTIRLFDHGDMWYCHYEKYSGDWSAWDKSTDRGAAATAACSDNSVALASPGLRNVAISSTAPTDTAALWLW